MTSQKRAMKQVARVSSETSQTRNAFPLDRQLFQYCSSSCKLVIIIFSSVVFGVRGIVLLFILLLSRRVASQSHETLLRGALHLLLRVHTSSCL